MSFQEHHKSLSHSRSPSSKDIDALKEDYQLQYFIKSSKVKLKKQILIENSSDDHLTYDHFIQAARKVQFRFAQAKHIIKLKNFFMDHNNRLPVQELIDRMIFVEQSKDNVIINFNLDYKHDINDITRREAELIDKQSSSPSSQIKNKSGLMSHSPSGNNLGGGGLSKSPSRNLLPYQQREQYSGDKVLQQSSVMQNRSKYLGGNAGSTLKKSMVKTTNTSPEERIFNVCVEKDISFGLLTELEKKGIDMRCIKQVIIEHMKLDVKATGFVDQNMLVKEINSKQFWNTRQKQELMKIIDNASVKGLVSFVKINHFALAFSKLPQAYKQMTIIQNQQKKTNFNKFRSEFTTIQQYLHIIRESLRNGQFQSHSSAFIFFDSNCDSYITIEEFLCGCQILSIELSDDQILEAFDFLDRQKKGFLTEEEFKNFYYNLHDFQLNVPIVIPTKSKQSSPLSANKTKIVRRQRAPSLNGNYMYLSEQEYDLNPITARRQSVTSKYYNNNYLNRKSPEERQQFFRSDSHEEFQINKQKQEQDLIINKYRQRIDNILNQSKKLRSVSANKTAIMRQQYINKIYQYGNQSFNGQMNTQSNIKPQRRLHTDQDYEYQAQTNDLPYKDQYDSYDKNKSIVKFSPHIHSHTQPFDPYKEGTPNFENISVPSKLNNSVGVVKPSLKQSQIHKQDLQQKYNSSTQYDSNEFLDRVDSLKDLSDNTKANNF